QSVALNIWPGEGVKLVISDNGFGMSEATQRRAFEPFFTTRASAHAPGLGLTVAHSVTHLHGGQIRLESKEDHGTTVTIWLPITKGPETTAPTARPASTQKTPVREPRGRM